MSDTKHNQSASEAFEQVLADRIRSIVGDIIPEEVLREKITSVFNSAFFVSAGYHNEKRPSPFFEKILTEIVKEKADEIVKPYLETIRPAMDKIIAERIQNGLLMSMIEQIDGAIKGNMYMEINDLKSKLRNVGINIGY